MATNEETGEYIGLGNTPQERAMDADIQDLMDDITVPHFLELIAYFEACVEYIRDMSSSNDPHDVERFQKARTRLGSLMIWQGWEPASDYEGKGFPTESFLR